MRQKDRHRFRSAWLATCLVLLVLNGTDAASPTVAHYRGLRYEGVVGQTDWFTCGPAALATLLTFYYDMPSTEEEMLEAALRSETEADNLNPEEGLSLLSLKHALLDKGITSQGYLVTLEALVEYFRRGGLPVILHVTEPQLHYVVAVGVTERDIVLADPSLGLYAFPVDALVHEKGFSGTILVPLPEEGSLIATAASRQKEVLRQYEERQNQLHALRRRF